MKVPRHFGHIPREVRREPGRDSWIDRGAIGDVIFFSIIALIYVGVFVFAIVKGHARDLGQWSQNESPVGKWYRELMQPDNPTVSCCGQADAYWADSFEVEGDHYVAIITDERDDTDLGRIHRPPGSKFEVPNGKLKYDRGNPTGHGVVFIGGTGQVLCYVVPGGV